MSVLFQETTGTLRAARLWPVLDERPRILHLITSFETGGTERQAAELLLRLDESAWDVRLAVLHRRGQLLERLKDRFPSPPEFPLTSFYNLNAVRQLWRLCRLLRAQRISLLHAHDFYAGILGGVAARLTRTPMIAAQRHLRLSDRRIHDYGTRLIHRLAGRVLVNSAAIREHLLTRSAVPPEKIAVIHNGLLTDGGVSRAESRAESRAALIRELALPPSAILIGQVARLEEVKGHRYVIAAAAQIVPDHPEVHFIFIGDGSLREQLRAQAAQLGLTNHVHLPGDRPDAATLIAGCDVAVLASLHEGFPNAVLEAMAAGVPVIATDSGGTKEMIRSGETGRLIPPADADALARSISQALAHPAHSEAMAARARAFVERRFGLKRMVTAVEQLYQDTLSAHQS